MCTVHDFVPLMTAVIWPLTILILVFSFRSRIRDLLTSLTEAKIGNNVLRFGQASSDSGDNERKILPSADDGDVITPSIPKLNKVANVFWLGNDLEWTAQTVLRGAPKEKILHGLKQCCHHSSEIGLGQTAPARLLLEMKAQVESFPEEALVREWRNNFSEKLYSAVRGFSILLREHQPEFRPHSSQ
jgi:hypothetical protein